MEDIETLYEKLGSQRLVAEHLGVAKSTVWERLKRAKESKGERVVGETSIPNLPPDNLPIEERIDILCRKFEAKKRAYDLNTWFPVTVHDELPIGLVFFGDPHIDNPGANWPLLKKHAEITKTTPGMYGINIGDTTDNWNGGLARLYAHNSVSVKEARELAEWFMHGSGINWLVWLVGNHDAWGDGSAIIDLLAKKYGTRKLIAHEWECRFRMVFKAAGGYEYRINAAHNFPGNSMWNPLHGNLKTALMGGDADIIACGHLHNYAYMTFENANRGRIQHLLRVRGYKMMDSYARQLGIVEQEHGAAAMFVFDPWAREPQARLTFHSSVEAGADYLTMIRAKRDAHKAQTDTRSKSQ